MIFLKKTGIFYENHVNPDHEDYVYRQVDSLLPYLGEVIEIEEDVTLRDFFFVIAEDIEMIEAVFSFHLGSHPLLPYIEEILQDCIPENKEDMEYIECSWVAEQFDYRLFYEQHKDDPDDTFGPFGDGLHKPDSNINEISIYVDVHGWGPYVPSEDEHYDKDHPAPTHISYGIEFTPLHKMAHLPIKLNKKFVMRGKNEMGDEKPIVEGEKDFSVFEVFGEILSEISFCGLPQERDEKWQDVTDTVDEAKKRLEEEEKEEEEGDAE